MLCTEFCYRQSIPHSSQVYAHRWTALPSIHLVRLYLPCPPGPAGTIGRKSVLPNRSRPTHLRYRSHIARGVTRDGKAKGKRCEATYWISGTPITCSTLYLRFDLRSDTISATTIGSARSPIAAEPRPVPIIKIELSGLLVEFSPNASRGRRQRNGIFGKASLDW
jgi:hypothetical protein